MRLKAPLILLLALAAPLRVSAQPAFTPPEPIQPAPVDPVPVDPAPVDPVLAPILDPATFISLLHAHYREGPWAEQLMLELTPLNASPRRTSVRIACDPTSDLATPPLTPAIRLELDTLTIVATPTKFIAINAAAPDLVFETTLSPSRPFLEQLRELMPAMPFPQLFLALNESTQTAWAHAIASVAPSVDAPLTIDRPPPDRAPDLAPDLAAGLVTLRASTAASSDNQPASTFQAKLLPDRGRFIELFARDTFGTAPGTLRISCKPLDPPPPDAFTLDTANRQRVDSLARLRPPEPEIKPGMRLPALGLVDDALALWSPHAAFEAQRTPLNTPLRLAMVFYDATDEATENQPAQADDAFEACLLARGLSDKYRRESVNSDRTPQPDEPESLPRVGVVPVAVFDIAAFGPQAVRDEAIAWSELGTPGAFTSAGPPLLKRFNATGGVSIVVIDEGQIVRGVVPWQGRTPAQRRHDLDAALRGSPSPNAP